MDTKKENISIESIIMITKNIIILFFINGTLYYDNYFEPLYNNKPNSEYGEDLYSFIVE